MKLSVFAVLLQDRSFEDACKYLSSLGVQAVEIGCGGFPGKAHCDPEVLLKDPAKLAEFKSTIEDSGIELAALSTHGNCVHPDPAVAAAFEKDYHNAVLLAEKLGIDRIVTFSGCPGGSPADRTPNWVTCPWPDDFSQILEYQWNDVLIPYWKKTAAFAQSYSATDEDSGQTLTVTEYIDGTQKRSYTATSGQTYSFNITAAEWVKLLNGSHTLKIVAADNYGGSATRTYTFTKNETEIELTLATPLTADDMVTKGIMSVVRQIPAGAKFTVEVCNNGNDASPTWEDVTQNVVSGSKFFLSNTTKTASAWGYNFRIKVKRGTATGDCFITSAGGNFE